MIEVKKLSKRYGPRLAVDHISFEARSGEIVGLLGPNGAGKTTTIRMLTGYMPPTEGTALIAGFDVLKDSMAVRQRVGYMPERVPIYPDMTVQAYVTFWAKLRGVRQPRAQVNAVLERVQLSDRRNTLLRNLSKGLTQRVGLAQALVHNPEVVILDEPTIGIDPQQVIEVRETVRELGSEHTVLFSTHILSEAEQVCDRVIIINQGRIVAEGKPEDLSQRLQPGTHLFVIVDDAAADPLEVLQQIPGVDAVHPQDNGYLLSAQATADIRGAVSEHIAQAGLTLLEMRPVEVSLEDIFLDLVGKED